MTRTQRKARADAMDVSEMALETLVGYNLKRAYVVLQNDYRAVMGDHGLSPRVFSALTFVVEMPNLTQSDLARRLGIERSGLVAIVDELEARGYLNRVAVPQDRRIQALAPTEAGLQAYEAALALINDHENRMLHMLNAEEREQLVHLLKKIREIGE
ncbi:MarR family transcriptional regulator [Sulfitobacter pseudonitzschiae]|uniref:MarR family transcriptional regulator n=1 Tax=Pseudosulfitobacter pseudonitzschiae TaxID=1402135 RepID=A0A9Q2NNH0_9RHOB|nr:MarR family transcriptional regulator [Pseudosulfitobacter pseudonitzschiae]MBM2293953.1 MarR family transcriptional regulator [Pseudosulfitobacter pseudonitzschiae]MBM2298900.1 MarR family transcriptional regulator [Pseudosulfitobacter pseudonitzschiae]MBM2303814.1 MarR family transcriptional regulator [Pseudosulfitobacter pseudonitzschiae]MBM2313567.1 MarR family transcriptional regulator [Pseudosulfitobacter pseudonitzschiae]MBM2318511.1 MarR family transcriptional regulator [Pseudosulfi